MNLNQYRKSVTFESIVKWLNGSYLPVTSEIISVLTEGDCNRFRGSTFSDPVDFWESVTKIVTAPDAVDLYSLAKNTNFNEYEKTRVLITTPESFDVKKQQLLFYVSLNGGDKCMNIYLYQPSRSTMSLNIVE